MMKNSDSGQVPKSNKPRARPRQPSRGAKGIKEPSLCPPATGQENNQLPTTDDDDEEAEQPATKETIPLRDPDQKRKKMELLEKNYNGKLVSKDGVEDPKDAQIAQRQTGNPEAVEGKSGGFFNQHRDQRLMVSSTPPPPQTAHR